jgi:CRISPR-associated endonuclease/helicase Cas3
MAHSATTREENNGDEDEPFELTEEERNPQPLSGNPTQPLEHLWQRLGAKKKLILEPNAEKPADAIANCALKFKDTGCAVLVYAREVEQVKTITDKLRKSCGVEMLTGTQRGFERNKLVESHVFQRFLPESDRRKDITLTRDTVYLVCTSAGEVGINISADHLVCDLSTFDSMVQRFGRVNRFGLRDDTQIYVIPPVMFEENKLEQQREKTLELLKQLDGDASPLAIGRLDAKARADAFAPEPKILPATDILFDSWSLTSIRGKFSGRPPVEPYLHGLNEWEPPETRFAWREEVEKITSEFQNQ